MAPATLGISLIDMEFPHAERWGPSRWWLAIPWSRSMTKKNLVVVAVFLTGLLGGGTAALAFSPSDKAPCAEDMCWDQYHHCIVCPE